ncbi:hypothetical protein CVT24_006460 [Panaeolus cyanescens]|uniref:F-box domain-containing protein n=1 Tax=Panaeolus cyanescens TaxID=181874 RepID=A0A409VZD3_9AGAR|nr:hypothetical protein CVT24_006460 [Panaeolus cyanescens]
MPDRTTKDNTMGLPTELVYSIFNHLENMDDLLNVAMSSKEFYGIALDIVFTRNQLDPQSSTLLLNINTDNISCLPALCLWHQFHINHRLARLEFRYGRYPDLKGVESIYSDLKLLRNYITKLGSVDEVNLVLVAPSEATTPDLGEATVELLRAILDRKCSDLHVSTTRLVDTRGHIGETVLFPSDGRFVNNPRPNDWVWRKIHAARLPYNQNGRLRKCTIHTFPTFLRQFYFDALQSNSNVLTELCFHRVFDGVDDWTTLMTSLRLPRLRCLRIFVCIILQEPVAKFLSNHRDLTILQYHHIRYHNPPATNLPRLSPMFFQDLEELNTTPRHLLHFLPPVSTLPELRILTIKIEVLHPDFAAVEEALASLEGCVNRIDLTLYITTAGLGFEAWMQTIEALPGGIIGASEQRPERLLYPVKSLTLYNGSWGWTVECLVRVMRWVSLFPALEAVEFDAHPSSAKTIKLDSEAEDALVQDLRRVCNKTLKVLIKSPERDIRFLLNE